MEFYQEEEVLPYMSNMWQDALQNICGLHSRYFNGKHQDCPACGGKDRFRWTNKKDNKVGDGWAYCNSCGADKGIGWLMKLSGEPYSECINILGRFLGKVPQEYVIKQNKRASRDPGYSFGGMAEHEKCEAVMSRTEKRAVTPLTQFEGFYSESDYTVGVKVTESGSEVITHVCGVNLVQEDGLDDDLCNLLFIDEEGRYQHYAKDYTRGAVVRVGEPTDKAIYLTCDWIEANHIHLATGQEVWVCFEPSNMEMVAFRYKGDREMRVACNQSDEDSLIVADDRELKVIVCNGQSFKNGAVRALYDPKELLSKL